MASTIQTRLQCVTNHVGRYEREDVEMIDGFDEKDLCQFVAHVLRNKTNFFSLNSACAAALVAASFLDLLESAPGSIVMDCILHCHFQRSS